MAKRTKTLPQTQALVVRMLAGKAHAQRHTVDGRAVNALVKKNLVTEVAGPIPFVEYIALTPAGAAIAATLPL